MANNATCKTELCFTAPNERGTLASWTTPLSECGVNIEAMCAYEQGSDNAYFRFITSDNAKAKNCLTEKGFNVTENNVVCWNTNNTPGVLNKVSSTMAEKGINFSCAYAGCCADSNTSYVVFCCDNPTEVQNTINNCGSCCNG